MTEYTTREREELKKGLLRDQEVYFMGEFIGINQQVVDPENGQITTVSWNPVKGKSLEMDRQVKGPKVQKVKEPEKKVRSVIKGKIKAPKKLSSIKKTNRVSSPVRNIER